MAFFLCNRYSEGFNSNLVVSKSTDSEGTKSVVIRTK